MDETACRVLAKERALRPAQHLDALDVEQLRIERTLVAEEHIVRVDGNRAFVQARRKRIALNAAQVEAWWRIFAPFRRDVEAGHLRGNRRQVGEIEFLYRLGAERRDRGRHVDQRLLPLLRRNDNFILSLSPGRRSGRYQRSTCARSSDQSPRSSKAQFPMGSKFAPLSSPILKKQ